MHSSVDIQKQFAIKIVLGYMCKKLDSARMYEILCVSVSILHGKILIKTDFLRYKFGHTMTVTLVRSRGLRNQIELI